MKFCNLAFPAFPTFPAPPSLCPSEGGSGEGRDAWKHRSRNEKATARKSPSTPPPFRGSVCRRGQYAL